MQRRLLGQMPVVYLTVDEVVEALGFNNRQAVYDAINTGKLKGVKDPETRTWLVSQESVERYEKPRCGRPRKRR